MHMSQRPDEELEILSWTSGYTLCIQGIKDKVMHVSMNISIG